MEFFGSEKPWESLVPGMLRDVNVLDLVPAGKGTGGKDTGTLSREQLLL